MFVERSLNWRGSTGEQGKVDESMREMQAIEALKNEKAEKEVSSSNNALEYRTLTDGILWYSESCNS